MIDQGAVRIDDEIVDGIELARDRLVGAIIRVGKRRFARLVD
jgi:hypothetical protein